MKTPYGLLGYCSNIHPGEAWQAHFQELKSYVPQVKQHLSPNQPFGLGLRIAGQASQDLLQGQALEELKAWLAQEDLYVFTINGFPYGGFHDTVVKDQVHAPDWTHKERKDYTWRLAQILVALMPEDLNEAGISTAPLSYRYWFADDARLQEAKQETTQALVDLVLDLMQLKASTGKSIHIDIEPEPDGLLGDHQDLMDWYKTCFIPLGTQRFLGLGLSPAQAKEVLLEHVQVCFDVCHYGVNYDDIPKALADFEAAGIRVGKLQISSALRVDFQSQAQEKLAHLKQFQERVYLHQVKARLSHGGYVSYPDLDQAFEAWTPEHLEWRVHYHVPIYSPDYGLLGSTQDQITRALIALKNKAYTSQMEVETYTWSVLPSDQQIPIVDSVVRELDWVLNQLQHA